MKIIETQEEYEEYMGRLRTLMIENPESSDEIGVLSLIIGEWEDKTVNIPAPDPIGMIRFHQDRLGLKDYQMAKLLGTSKTRFSEVMNHKRKLTVALIRKCVALGMSAHVMIKYYGSDTERIKQRISKLRDEADRLESLI